jgi:hypothetical protein
VSIVRWKVCVTSSTYVAHCLCPFRPHHQEDMMLRTFDYIDKLVQIIKPQKLLLMAIDGKCTYSGTYHHRAWVATAEIHNTRLYWVACLQGAHPEPR